MNSLDWKYKVEGAVHILVEYIGSDETKKGKVLKVKKTIKKKILGFQDELNYLEKVFKSIPSLIPFLPNGVILDVDRDFLYSLSNQVNPLRPKIRLSDNIDLNANKVLLMQDLTSNELQTPNSSKIQLLTIEIKPKCGVLPSSKFISSENQCKFQTCRYCMHQALKLVEGKAKNQSNYCPLDLFSGDLIRIRKALNCLFSEPQNNLKLFLDNHLLFTGLLGGLEDDNKNPNDLFSKELDSFSIAFNNRGNGVDDTKKANDLNSNAKRKDLVSNLVEILCEILQKELLLSELKKLHALDKLDIEAIEFLTRKYMSNGNFVARKHDERFHDLELEVEKQSNKKEYVQKLIDEYLLSMTAKDCSILISLALTIENEKIQQNTNNDDKKSQPSNFKVISKDLSYRILMIDLDPKSFDNIDHYFHLDDQIVSTFRMNDSIKKKKCFA